MYIGWKDHSENIQKTHNSLAEHTYICRIQCSIAYSPHRNVWTLQYVYMSSCFLSLFWKARNGLGYPFFRSCGACKATTYQQTSPPDSIFDCELSGITWDFWILAMPIEQAPGRKQFRLDADSNCCQIFHDFLSNEISTPNMLYHSLASVGSSKQNHQNWPKIWFQSQHPFPLRYCWDDRLYINCVCCVGFVNCADDSAILSSRHIGVPNHLDPSEDAIIQACNTSITKEWVGEPEIPFLFFLNLFLEKAFTLVGECKDSLGVFQLFPSQFCSVIIPP